jgi:hypothetical protein
MNTPKRTKISRREPVITLGNLRFRGRNYKEGDYMDRRRCRMSHSKLISLLRSGVCVLAKDLKPADLKKYGYVYDANDPRTKMKKIEPSKDSLTDEVEYIKKTKQRKKPLYNSGGKK